MDSNKVINLPNTALLLIEKPNDKTSEERPVIDLALLRAERAFVAWLQLLIDLDWRQYCSTAIRLLIKGH